MTRRTKLKLNITFTVLNQIITLISGFVIPRLIIQNYTSEINGLVSSITQFLSVIMFCEMGVGAVVQYTLYKPISTNDIDKISKIYQSSQLFFRKIAYILSVYIIILCITYPFIVKSEESIIGIIILIGAIAFRMFTQYYFSITYRIILVASQMVYIPMMIGSITTILNILMTYWLIDLNRTIQEVQIASSMAFLIQPIVFSIVVNKLYKLNKSIQYSEEPIKQKWNGFAQHLATIFQENSPVIILTVFTNVALVSVYAVYHMVTNGIKLFFVSFISNIHALLGDMYAKQETQILNKTFDFLEWGTFMASTILYTIANLSLIPFIQLYIGADPDINYVYPKFGIAICIYMAIYTVRMPYSYMIQAAGHFKQTQNSAFIELVISLVLSCVLVTKFGLLGISVGATIAILYRTIYFIIYLKSHILRRNLNKTIRLFLISCLIILSIVFVSRFIPFYQHSVFSWCIYTTTMLILAILITLVINILFYKDFLTTLFVKMKHK